VVEGDERALACVARAERGCICAADELCPEAVHGLGPGLKERVGDVGQERGRRGEVGERERLELEAFPLLCEQYGSAAMKREDLEPRTKSWSRNCTICPSVMFVRPPAASALKSASV
jgi:hypothetical protein